MAKLLSLFMILFFSLSCGKSDSDGQNESFSQALLPEDDTNRITDADPVPPEAQSFNINVTYVNFSAEQKAKYEQAVEIVKKVVASEEFKSLVLNHTYGGQTTYVDNAGRSNSTIYRHILNGNEVLQPEKNNQMDVEVELYYAATTTIGYTYPNSKRIWVNTKYFNVYTPTNVAGNLFHEWLHKLGYAHSSTYSVSRDFSVPYAIGRMISNLGKQYEY